MKKLILLFLIIQVLSSLSAADHFFNGQWIDLTHEFSKETIYWPTEEPLNKTTVFDGYTDDGYYYTA